MPAPCEERGDIRSLNARLEAKCWRLQNCRQQPASVLRDAMKPDRPLVLRFHRSSPSEFGLQIAATALAWPGVRVHAGGFQVGVPERRPYERDGTPLSMAYDACAWRSQRMALDQDGQQLTIGGTRGQPVDHGVEDFGRRRLVLQFTSGRGPRRRSYNPGSIAPRRRNFVVIHRFFWLNFEIGLVEGTVGGIRGLTHQKASSRLLIVPQKNFCHQRNKRVPAGVLDTDRCFVASAEVSICALKGDGYEHACGPAGVHSEQAEKGAFLNQIASIVACCPVRADG